MSESKAVLHHPHLQAFDELLLLQSCMLVPWEKIPGT